MTKIDTDIAEIHQLFMVDSESLKNNEASDVASVATFDEQVSNLDLPEDESPKLDGDGVEEENSAIEGSRADPDPDPDPKPDDPKRSADDIITAMLDGDPVVEVQPKSEVGEVGDAAAEVFDDLPVEVKLEKKVEGKTEKVIEKTVEKEESQLVEETKKLIDTKGSAHKQVVDELGLDDEIDKAAITRLSELNLLVDELPEGEIEWVTSNQQTRYDNFYIEKFKMIKFVIGNQQLEFTRLRRELRDSSVKIAPDVFDLYYLRSVMVKVQMIKDRVAQIQTDINEQYWQWERIIELLRGVLARTHYERGKQDGVVYEHMRDVESYFLKLKSLYKTADIISKNLDSAYEVLSRQVTIATPIKNADRVDTMSQKSLLYPTETSAHKEVSKEIAECDDLEIANVSAFPNPKAHENSVTGDEIEQGWDRVRAKRSYTGG